MAQYWHLSKLLFQRIAIFSKPALVSIEPDFWGFVESQAPGGDPTKVQSGDGRARLCGVRERPDGLGGLPHPPRPDVCPEGAHRFSAFQLGSSQHR